MRSKHRRARKALNFKSVHLAACIIESKLFKIIESSAISGSKNAKLRLLPAVWTKGH